MLDTALVPRRSPTDKLSDLNFGEIAVLDLLKFCLPHQGAVLLFTANGGKIMAVKRSTHGIRAAIRTNLANREPQP